MKKDNKEFQINFKAAVGSDERELKRFLEAKCVENSIKNRLYDILDEDYIVSDDWKKIF